MNQLDVETLIGHLRTEGRAFADIAETLDPKTSVPACPGWDVDHLIRHLGTTHRWAADIVANRRTTLPHRRDFGPVGDVDAVSWYRSALAGLLETLVKAQAGLRCATLYPVSNGRWFWANRQALETAMHRADLEITRGDAHSHFDTALANQGIREVLTYFGPQIAGKAPFEHRGVLEVRPADGLPWTVTMGTAGLRCEARGIERWDARVRGSNSQVFLWLWNRPCGAVVDGDNEVAAQWTEQVRI